MERDEDARYFVQTVTEAISGSPYDRARYYDPNIGRFLREDPIGEPGDSHLYQYVHASPLNGIDPTGLRDVIVVVWNQSGTSVGHVLVLETDGQVILNQFPEPHATHGENVVKFNNYRDTRNFEGRDPNRAFRVYVPDDGDFDMVARNRRKRRWWDWYPYEERNETNCVEAAGSALRTGGVPVGDHAWPGNLGDDLDKKSKQHPRPDQRWRVQRINITEIPGAQQ